MLKRQGVIDTWHDRRIGAGESINEAIDTQINRDDIILLLVSPDFLASDYCYDIEMKRAMERHEAGDAIVIPVILRACDWHHAPFGKLNAVPRDGKPITQWTDIDESFLEVAKAVRQAVARLNQTQQQEVLAETGSRPTHAASCADTPRSSNLRLAKSFSQKERDEFQSETFEFIARYFENSLNEISARNPGIESAFRRVDANRFFATLYADGKDAAKATIYMGGDIFAQGINYVQGHTAENNRLNESLNVDADDQTMYLRAMGLLQFGTESEKKLSPEGAAEFYWGNFIRPLQRSS